VSKREPTNKIIFKGGYKPQQARDELARRFQDFNKYTVDAIVRESPRGPPEVPSSSDEEAAREAAKRFIWEPSGVPTVGLGTSLFDGPDDELSHSTTSPSGAAIPGQADEMPLLAGRYDFPWHGCNRAGWPQEVADFYCIYAAAQTANIYRRINMDKQKNDRAALSPEAFYGADRSCIDHDRAVRFVKKACAWLRSHRFLDGQANSALPRKNLIDHLLAWNAVGWTARPMFYRDAKQAVRVDRRLERWYARTSDDGVSRPRRSSDVNVITLTRHEVALILIGLEIPDIGERAVDTEGVVDFESVVNLIKVSRDRVTSKLLMDYRRTRSH
jgi:hypothetical protein